MNQHNKTTRFFAAILITGGILGIFSAALLGAYFLNAQGWPILLLVAGGIALFAWAIFTGFRLWQGTPYGRRWGIILFASQIPIIALYPTPQYQWFTGIQFSPILQLGDSFIKGGIEIGAGTYLFAIAQFCANITYPNTGGTASIIGVNIFAIIAVLLLIRANKSFKSTPLCDAT
jgi:MFS family permease